MSDLLESNIDKLSWVKAELVSYTGAKKQVGESLFVICPYHAEKTPSGRIFYSADSKSPGYFRCYGCSAHAPWNEVAPLLGLKPYGSVKPHEQYATSLRVDLDGDDDREPKQSPLPVGKKWRGFSTSFLSKVGCTMTDWYGTKYVFMPVYVFGSLRGWIRARIRKAEDKPSYINKPGAWSKTHGLFPFDYVLKPGTETVVLVEGPRDALRLIRAGIPALCILGTHSWSTKKSSLLEVAGVKNVVFCFDGDDAGALAEEKILPFVEDMFSVQVFSLRDKDSPYWPYRKEDAPAKAAKADGTELWDPCSMPNSKLAELKQLVERL